MAETVKIDLELLTQQVEEGKKREELAQYWGLNISQMKNALKAAGLTIRKFHKPAFEFVTATETVVENVDTDVETEAVEEVAVEETPTEELAQSPGEDAVNTDEPEVTWK